MKQNNFNDFLEWYNNLNNIHVINGSNIDSVLERFDI